MKTGIIASVLAAVLGFGSVADACHGTHKGVARTGNSIHGTVASVGKNTMSLSVATSNGNQMYTVNITRQTAISGKGTTGKSAHKVNASMVGASVTVVGAENGATIRASEIVVNG